MNRIEFMTELASLLQDVPVAERKEAMQYYNDYFDDAGEENEQQVIEELGEPATVAANIKADLRGDFQDAGEYTENGYTDARYEQKNMPTERESHKESQEEYRGGYQSYEEQRPPRTSKILKIILIIAIILMAGPVIIPVALGIAALIIGCVVVLFAVFVALVIASIAVVIAGVSVFCVGIINLIPELAIGLALVGTGLILSVLGVIATVASVRLCIIVFPGICRGIVWLCRKPFHRRVVA